MTNEKRPVLSVIVPIYQSEKTITRCIDSILSQTFSSFELLLIDDGSTDSSASICDSYSLTDTRVKVFHRTNMGVSAARNFGLECAKGAWIKFVDSDDWLESNCFETIFDSVDERSDFLVHGLYKYYSNKRVAVSPQNMIIDISVGIGLLMNLLDSNEDVFGWPWNKLYKNDIITLNKIRFDESVNILEDELFNLNYCLFIDKVTIIPDLLYNYDNTIPVEYRLSKKLYSCELYELLINKFSMYLSSFDNLSVLTLNSIFDRIYGVFVLYIKSGLKQYSFFKIFNNVRTLLKLNLYRHYSKIKKSKSKMKRFCNPLVLSAYVILCLLRKHN